MVGQMLVHSRAAQVWVRHRIRNTCHLSDNAARSILLFHYSLFLTQLIVFFFLRSLFPNWTARRLKCIGAARFAFPITLSRCGPEMWASLASLMPWHLAWDRGWPSKFQISFPRASSFTRRANRAAAAALRHQPKYQIKKRKHHIVKIFIWWIKKFYSLTKFISWTRKVNFEILIISLHYNLIWNHTCIFLKY